MRGSLKSDGTQHATKEELRNFQSATGVYNKAWLKLLGAVDIVVDDVIIHEKKIWSRKNRIAMGALTHKKPEHRKD